MVKLEFEILVFVEGERLENLEKNPQGKARVTNRLDPHNYGSRLELNLGTLVWRRELSPLHHPGWYLYYSVLL